MRIGISVYPLFNKKGADKKIDGIGNYTSCLIKNLQTQSNVEVVQFYINSLQDTCKIFTGSQNMCIQPCLYFQDILPINFFKNLEKQVDLFHSTDYRIPKLKKTPLIATIYDAIPLKEEEFANQRLLSLKNYLLKKHVKRADHIISISNAMLEDIVNHWKVDPKKISIIHCGIDAIWFSNISMEQKKQVLDKYNIKKKFLLTVGTLQPRKNLDRVLLAYQSLPKDILSEYQLVIVGKRGWECSELIKKILFLEKQGLIKWLEFIPFNDLRALYQSSTSLVFPSLSEGFGLPIIEGFASKTPVITSNIPSILEVAGNAAYFVNPTSVEEIQYAISSLINNTGLVKNLIEKGSDRAKLFTMEEMGNKTMLVYKQFI